MAAEREVLEPIVGLGCVVNDTIANCHNSPVLEQPLSHGGILQPFSTDFPCYRHRLSPLPSFACLPLRLVAIASPPRGESTEHYNGM